MVIVIFIVLLPIANKSIGGWQSLRRPRSKVDFKNCDFSKKWRYSIVIRLKYVLFYKSHIEAAGRPAGRPPKCVCSKNEDLQAKIGEK